MDLFLIPEKSCVPKKSRPPLAEFLWPPLAEISLSFKSSLDKLHKYLLKVAVGMKTDLKHTKSANGHVSEKTEVR